MEDVQLKNCVEKRKDNNDRLRLLEKEIKELEKEKTIEIDIEELKKEISEKDNGIRLMETTLKEIILKLNEFEIKDKNSEEIKKKINELDTCPICQQKVTPEHKHSVIERV